MQLRTEVEIDASPRSVWSVLTDTSSYHEWNPFIVSLTGELVVGRTVQVNIAPPDGGEVSFAPKVLVVANEQELRWRGILMASWLLSGEHFFQLISVDDGRRTRFVHGEDFRGILLRFCGPLLTKTARGFVFMNQAIKRRAEEREASEQAAASVVKPGP